MKQGLPCLYWLRSCSVEEALEGSQGEGTQHLRPPWGPKLGPAPHTTATPSILLGQGHEVGGRPRTLTPSDGTFGALSTKGASCLSDLLLLDV